MTKSQAEPSMDDILASIRRIIADDAPPVEAPRVGIAPPPPPVTDLAQQMPAANGSLAARLNQVFGPQSSQDGPPPGVVPPPAIGPLPSAPPSAASARSAVENDIADLLEAGTRAGLSPSAAHQSAATSPGPLLPPAGGLRPGFTPDLPSRHEPVVIAAMSPAPSAGGQPRQATPQTMLAGLSPGLNPLAGPVQPRESAQGRPLPGTLDLSALVPASARPITGSPPRSEPKLPDVAPPVSASGSPAPAVSPTGSPIDTPPRDAELASVARGLEASLRFGPQPGQQTGTAPSPVASPAASLEPAPTAGAASATVAATPSPALVPGASASPQGKIERVAEASPAESASVRPISSTVSSVPAPTLVGGTSTAAASPPPEQPLSAASKLAERSVVTALPVRTGSPSKPAPPFIPSMPDVPTSAAATETAIPAPVSAAPTPSKGSEPPKATAPTIAAAASIAAASKVEPTSTALTPTMNMLPVSAAFEPSALSQSEFEDTAAELLRPMLKQWLDTNMPRIVEKALRRELAENPPTLDKPDDEKA